MSTQENCKNCVYSSTIHDSPKLETTQRPMDRWKDRPHVAKPHNGILFRNKPLMQGTTGMDLQMLCPVKERKHIRPHITWFHWCEMPKRGKSIETETGCLGLGRRESGSDRYWAAGILVRWCRWSELDWWWLHTLENLLKSRELYTLY